MKNRIFAYGAMIVPLVLCASRANAGTEQLALGSSLKYSQVIKGGEAEVDAYVRNYAPNGSDEANYKITAAYAAPGSVSYTSVGYFYEGAQPADGGVSTSATVPFPIDTSLFTPGTASVTVSATDTDTNSVLTQGWQFTVLRHATPEVYSYVQKKYVAVEPPPAEPSVDPLAFGATGGGESFAAIDFPPPVLGNDPPGVPTAGMALNWITSSGDSQITSNFATFANLAPLSDGDENPADGDPFTVQYDTTHPGTFSRTFWLGFSDEQDLPGADSPGSYVAELLYTATVAPDGSSTYEVDLVPEPSTLALLTLGSLGLLARSVIRR
jgi:hypothetical protein